MVRFVNGAPTTVYISTHSDGSAYNYASMPKNGVRPIAYIAAGDHANYGTSGSQPYPVPVIGPIVDHTGQGAFWDSTLNFRGYWFDNSSQTFTAAPGAGAGGQEQLNETPDWLSFQGAWGDDTPSTDILKNEQYCIFSECHYTAGPTGTYFRRHHSVTLKLTDVQAPSRRTSAGRASANRAPARSQTRSRRSLYPRTSTSTSRPSEMRFSRHRTVASSTTSLTRPRRAHERCISRRH
jgi:hypothetical protein